MKNNVIYNIYMMFIFMVWGLITMTLIVSIIGLAFMEEWFDFSHKLAKTLTKNESN
ncbi:MAG: hypothetical protein ACRDD8_06130 [Bacteroidales bacterium]